MKNYMSNLTMCLTNQWRWRQAWSYLWYNLANAIHICLCSNVAQEACVSNARMTEMAIKRRLFSEVVVSWLSDNERRLELEADSLWRSSLGEENSNIVMKWLYNEEGNETLCERASSHGCEERLSRRQWLGGRRAEEEAELTFKLFYLGEYITVFLMPVSLVELLSMFPLGDALWKVWEEGGRWLLPHPTLKCCSWLSCVLLLAFDEVRLSLCLFCWRRTLTVQWLEVCCLLQLPVSLLEEMLCLIPWSCLAVECLEVPGHLVVCWADGEALFCIDDLSPSVWPLGRADAFRALMLLWWGACWWCLWGWPEGHCSRLTVCEKWRPLVLCVWPSLWENPTSRYACGEAVVNLCCWWKQEENRLGGYYEALLPCCWPVVVPQWQSWRP